MDSVRVYGHTSYIYIVCMQLYTYMHSLYAPLHIHMHIHTYMYYRYYADPTRTYDRDALHTYMYTITVTVTDNLLRYTSYRKAPPFPLMFTVYGHG
jgi:hypothetical protein